MIQGIYKDVVYCFDSQSANDYGWKSNRIVSGSDILVASLMKGEPDIEGILYLAIGSGEAQWDGMNLSAGAFAAQLSNEILRLPIQSSDITFIDLQNQPSLTPTSRLEIRVDINGDDIVNEGFLSLREFGLFGGNANEALNSGRLINYVIHPRIDLTSNATLTRQLRLSFSSAVSTSEDDAQFPISNAPQWLRESPLIIIDGIGPIYGDRLLGIGITTVEDLSGIEINNLEINIPTMKLAEFKTKAISALRVMTNLRVVNGIQTSTIRELMITSAEDLAARTSESINQIIQMQEQLNQLQVAMDDSFLENRRLFELVSYIEE